MSSNYSFDMIKKMAFEKELEVLIYNEYCTRPEVSDVVKTYLQNRLKEIKEKYKE